MSIQSLMQEYIGYHYRLISFLQQPDTIDGIGEIIKNLHAAWHEGRQIFVFGNGGSAANVSHFVTDLGKGASQALGKPFRCVSLNDNVPWITALANDMAYNAVFVGQLQNYAKKDDVVIGVSVSGNSPNVVAAFKWARAHKLWCYALVGQNKCALDELSHVILHVPSTHYGRVEDTQMVMLHMIAYAFMENPHHFKETLCQ